jgi:hypothetical protein
MTGEPSSVIEQLEQIRCEGFRAKLTPFACILNQLFPKRWSPCETCKQGVTIRAIKQAPAYNLTLSLVLKAGGELAWEFEKPRPKRRKRRTWDTKKMSLGVAKSLGLA